MAQASINRHGRQRMKATAISAFLLAGLLQQGAALASSNPEPTVFKEIPRNVLPGRHGTMKIRGRANTTPLKAGEQTTVLSLPDGRQITIDRTSFARRTADRVTWRGKVRGRIHSGATLSVNGNYIAGRIRLENEVYEVRPTGTGEIEVEWLEEGSFPACDAADPELAVTSEVTELAELATNPPANDGGNPELSLLVLYDSAALANVSYSIAAMETQVDAAVATINTAFLNSNVSATAKLVHTQQISHSQTSGEGLLNWLETDAGVAALRNTYGADLVSIITDFPDFCGVGNVQRVAAPYFSPSGVYQVTDFDCAVGNLTFVHETGHNLGMEHNPEEPFAPSIYNNGTSYAGYEHSFGHWDNSSAVTSEHYRSIMSYATPCSTCTRLAQFSNPNLNFTPGGVDSGKASGVTGSPGETDGRNNALTANLTAPYVAEFRTDVTGSDANYFPITSPEDDAQENNTTGAVEPNFTGIEIGYFPQSPFPDTTVGLRFQSLPIPQRAYISEAHVELKAKYTDSFNSWATISVEDADDAAAFASSDNNISERSRGSSVPWNNIENWTANQTHRTPDLTSLVQEIVDRSGWNPYQSIAFILHDTSGYRHAYSYNNIYVGGSASDVPRLYVKWSACGGSRDLPGSSAWSLFSVPCVNRQNTVQDLFTGLNIAEYGSVWAVLSYDPNLDLYSFVDATETLQPGKAYWYINEGGNFTFNIRGEEIGGLESSSTDVPLEGVFGTGAFNLVGHTSMQNIPWAQVRVIDGTRELTLDEADPGGICTTDASDPSCIMSRVMSKWESGNFNPYDGVTPGMEGSLQAFDGIWVQAFKPGLSLRIPMVTTGDLDEVPSNSGTGVNQGKASGENWFMRLSVKSGEQRDNGNVLGQLPDSLKGKDRHDLEERAPQGDSWLSLTFNNRAWQDEDAWGYTSDFRAPSRKPRGVWRFTVRASEDKDEATLRWSGYKHAIKRARLIDLETGERIRLKHAEEYTFPITGGERHFKLKIR